MSDKHKSDTKKVETENKVEAEEIVAETTQAEAEAEAETEQESKPEAIEDMDIEQLLQKLNEAEAKADENWDAALRSKAEMENIRRRSEIDISNARKFGIEKLATELLPVKDSLELGLKAVNELETNETIEKIIEGMQMTLQQLVTAMDKVGIVEVNPEEGEVFNPESHQAMSMLEMEGKKSNTVVSVFQKGYSLNSRLLRPAMVIIAK